MEEGSPVGPPFFVAIFQGKKYNYNLYLINLFLFINLVKSDSVLYLPVFVLVLAFLLNNKKQFNFPV